MTLPLKSFLFGAFMCMCAIAMAQTRAHAEIFYVESEEGGFSVTFPDTWKVISNQKPDDKITIAGPGTYEFSTCRVRVRQDRRFVIFPSQFDDEIQRLAFSRKFWDDYVGEYDNVNINAFKDNSGLGQGYASMAEVTFDTAEGAIVKKRGLMFASLYHDHLFIVDCSAEESVYDKWRPAFLGIVKSINYEPLRDRYMHGHYRQRDEKDDLVIEGPTELDVYKF